MTMTILLSIAAWTCFALGAIQFLSIAFCVWKNYGRTVQWLPHPKRIWTRYIIAQALKGGALVAIGVIATPIPGTLKVIVAALNIGAFFVSSFVEPKRFDLLPIRYNRLLTHVRTEYQSAAE